MRQSVRIAAAALTLAVAGTGAAQSVSELDRRVEVLERKLSSDALTGMVNDLSTLREDVSQLRGRIDVLERKLEQMQERQRQMYADIDERLRALEETRAPAPGGEAATGEGDSPATDADSGQGGDSGEQAASGEASGGSPEEAYQQAFNTLRDGRYEDAASQFGTYLERYPDSRLADNARYWLGESHYVVREFDTARQHFQRVLDDFPESAKRPDALLKIGFIQYEQGQRDASRETLREVRERFPDSTAASLAGQRLESLGGG